MVGILESKEPSSAMAIESVVQDRGIGFDQVRTRKLLHKIDWQLLPFLALLYLLSFLDRANIGNARLAGLESDLNMQGLDYNTAVAVFFPFYVASEIPSNIMMKRVRPSIWIPSIMVAWSVCTTLMGIVNNFSGLLVARMALGLAEGGLFPGVAFYITMWYRRHECGFRMALFFSAATCAGAFGGLLARGIMEMDGIGGRAGWSWIFILEGLATFLVAVAAYFYMSDYPATAKFLTSEESHEISRRLTEDSSNLTDEFKTKYIWDAIKDWKIWINMVITIGYFLFSFCISWEVADAFSVYTPLYSISLFLPTIVRGLGYTNETAQLMTVPPYVVACICTITGGYIADGRQTRGPFMIGFLIVGIVGVIMQLASHQNGVKYAGVFLACSGIYASVPQGIAWTGNNIGGSTKRGIGIAMHVGFGNIGGAISGFVYLPADSPRFIKGHSIVVAFLAMSMLLSLFMTTYLRMENKRRDMEYKAPSEYTTEEQLLEREAGDYASFFRYTV